MRRAVILASLLGAAVAGVWLPEVARGDSLSIGVQTDSMHLGIQIGNPPPLVVVPGMPVYTAPSLPYNYFVYHKQYFLFHEGFWLRAGHHNGPWTVISVERLPRAIRAVPVDYYRHRPDHWDQHGPPPWVEERHREQERERAHQQERGHGGDKGHGKNKGHNKDHG
jgi:hypothetical protein